MIYVGMIDTYQVQRSTGERSNMYKATVGLIEWMLVTMFILTFIFSLPIAVTVVYPSVCIINYMLKKGQLVRNKAMVMQ